VTLTATPTIDPTEGERRQRAALDLLAVRREALVRRGRRALLLRLLAAGAATADDVRVAVELPPGVGPRLFGAVPGKLAGDGIIQPAGYAATGRPQAHARPISVWALADRAAALDWLHDHPDITNPTPDAPPPGSLF
jgi:hypothetical protein